MVLLGKGVGSTLIFRGATHILHTWNPRSYLAMCLVISNHFLCTELKSSNWNTLYKLFFGVPGVFIYIYMYLQPPKPSFFWRYGKNQVFLEKTGFSESMDFKDDDPMNWYSWRCSKVNTLRASTFQFTKPKNQAMFFSLQDCWKCLAYVQLCT